VGLLGAIGAIGMLYALTDAPSAQAQPRPQAASAAAQPAVLVFSRTAGYRHDSIEAGVAMLRELGGMHGFAIEHSEDPAAFTAGDLDRYAAIVWLNTTGDALDAAGQAAFERYVEGGGGYVGIHAAADTEHDWPWYGELLGCGAWFKNHPPIQEARIETRDREHASTRHLEAELKVTDEWYNFKANPAPCAQVLLALDESSYTVGAGAMGDEHPIAWQRRQGSGRVWYTGLGHRIPLYSEPFFREHVLGGLRWAGALE
jgi:type 1 glutamine amidotransferase